MLERNIFKHTIVIQLAVGKMSCVLCQWYKVYNLKVFLCENYTSIVNTEYSKIFMWCLEAEKLCIN